MSSHDQKTELLLQALQKRRIVEATYDDSKGDTTIRQIAVLSVGHQYFTGYCYLRNELRTFKTNRVKALRVTERQIQQTGLLL